MPIHMPLMRDTIICPECGLAQFVASLPTCRRCRNPLGIEYIKLLPLDKVNRERVAQSIGALIRGLRLRRKWTQAELSSALGVARSQISRAECGRLLPSVSLVIRCAVALGVDRAFLRLHRRRTITNRADPCSRGDTLGARREM
jgi:DNA-binding XRE family transcriptional regulator